MSQEEDKLSKQRAFLAQYVKDAENCLVEGIRSLRYFCHPQADACEAELTKYRQTLLDIPPSKEALKEAVSGIESTGFYMMYLWNTAFMNVSSTTQTDNQYGETPSASQMKYQEKLSKAFENKQMHAPGFDGVGGGRARGS